AWDVNTKPPGTPGDRCRVSFLNSAWPRWGWCSEPPTHGALSCLAKAPRPQPAQGLPHPISVAGAGAWVLIKHNPKATSHR
uniref:Uncharacterized protein n=1 Tax=Anser cygnoides TaxID=8845 RepID=A0A8B9EBQ6_ANSCY